MTHKLVLVKQTEECVEWKCPACERHIRLELNGGGLTVLRPGDQLTNHGAATTAPGFTFNGTSVETADDSIEARSSMH